MDDITYVVQKKIISVHSEDRDVTKWPTPSQFEINLPVDHRNVKSIRLNEIELPTPLYVFSAEDQNTKMSVIVSGSPVRTIEIQNGNYTPAQMVLELEGKLNAATSSTFDIVYNEVTRKLVFTNSVPFTLCFESPESYDATTLSYFNYTKWGLGSYLGFTRENYNAVLSDVEIYSQSILMPSVYAVSAPFMLDVEGDTTIYMELATYNSIDEIMPYTEYSSDQFGAKFGGKHNSSFAKIPLEKRSSKDDYLSNMFFSEPPIERLQKLRFKMRYHDGRPVHFHGLEFNFTIELTTLRNDPVKNYKVNKNNYMLS